jgi:bacillithiol biosynthesis cysteine-adding enzyme BshC
MSTIQKKEISYASTGYFDQLVIDYLSGEEGLKEFYGLAPELTSFATAIENRTFDSETRTVLTDVLIRQYQNAGLQPGKDEPVEANIELLRRPTTYTITTGHQLCLFTGPLYFIYKIISTINACRQLKRTHPELDFVPIYWMASEDHDFAEVNHFHLFGKTYEWEQPATGAVGKLSSITINSVASELFERLGTSTEASALIAFFKRAYLGENTLSDATRILVHDLFKSDGLVCLDADDRELKSTFVDVMRDDLMHQMASKLVEKTSTKLAEEYKTQVTPRSINLFYLTDTMRSRIVKTEEGKYETVEGGVQFSESALLTELNEHPERFSPNVVLRPLYQERILPNLAYIGGGGEIAYWLQLKSTFQHFKINYPILLLRNSAMWIDRGSLKKLKKNNIVDVVNVFSPLETLIKQSTHQASLVDLELKDENKQLQSLYEELEKKAASVDVSLVSYIKSEEQKAITNLNNIKSRLMKAEKKNNETAINQLESAKERLFPNKGLQERYDNFASLYLNYGDDFFDLLKAHFDPFQNVFTVFYEAE